MHENKIKRARELRRDSSRAERICWELLRDRRLSGTKFRRQHPIGPFFADFACVSKKLVIEIDGEHHADQVEADARRTAIAIGRVLNESGRPPHPASPPSGGEEHKGA